jgi:uncharacterized membrane protein
MARKSTDLFVIGGSTILIILLVLVGLNRGPIAVILGLPFVLVFPGYVLTEAIMPRRPQGLPEQILLTVGLSVVVAILGGFILDRLPAGLQATTWALLLGTLILGGCLYLYLVRRRATHENEPMTEMLPAPRPKPTPWQIGLITLIGLLVVGSLAFTVYGAQHQPSPGFTQLWILPGTSTTTTASVQFGVKNEEGATVTYHLQVQENGVAIRDYATITISSNGTWETTLTLPTPPKRTSVAVTLYRTENPTTVYRSVLLWLGG